MCQSEGVRSRETKEKMRNRRAIGDLANGEPARMHEVFRQTRYYLL